jgi:hypothetical protein
LYALLYDGWTLKETKEMFLSNEPVERGPLFFTKLTDAPKP